MTTPANKVHQFERKALCHTCNTSNTVCTANPKTGLPECASCKDKRTKPNPAKAEEPSPQ